jgi:hypothetical protein
VYYRKTILLSPVLATLALSAVITPQAVAAPPQAAAITAATLAWATNTNDARVSDVRLAGFDQVLAHDDPCYDGSLQGSYYCYLKGGTQSQTHQDEYTPAQPPFGYKDLPQCSAGSSAIAGALSGEGCS